MEQVAKVGTQTRKLVGVERSGGEGNTDGRGVGWGGTQQLLSVGRESTGRASFFLAAHASSTGL